MDSHPSAASRLSGIARSIAFATTAGSTDDQFGWLVPHLAEEAWAERGESGMIVDAPWPSFNPAMLIDEEVTIAVQVNGKLRETMTAPRGLSREDAEERALALPKVQLQLAGGSPRKVIVVPDRLVNIVA